jgi:hypothetical protein
VKKKKKKKKKNWKKVMYDDNDDDEEEEYHSMRINRSAQKSFRGDVSECTPKHVDNVILQAYLLIIPKYVAFYFNSSMLGI